MKKITPHEKSALVGQLSGGILKKAVSIGREHDDYLSPSDMPNLLLATMINCFHWLENEMDMSHEDCEKLAKHTVAGLIASLAINNINTGIPLPDDLPMDRLGLSTSKGIVGGNS